MFSYRQFIIAFTRLERFIHLCHIVSCKEKATGCFSRVCLHCDASHRYLCCLSTYIYSHWLKFVSRHIHDPAIVPPSLIADAEDLVFSQCTGSQERYRIIDYSPTKSHQREQRANTYPFEQLRFLIHSGLILFALTLWERFRISVYSYAPTTRLVSFCDRAEATTLSWESIIYLNKGVSL